MKYLIKRERYIKFVKLDPWYRFYFSENNKFFDYSECLKKTEKEISKFNSSDVKGYYNLVNFSEKIFKVGFEQLSAKPFDNFFFMIKQLPKLLMLKSYLTVFGLVKKFIKNKHLRQALSIQPLLLGGNPTSTTSIYNLIHFLERKWGVHYAIGGTGNLIKALHKLMKEEKIKIFLNSEITNLITKKNEVIGVEVKKSKKYYADKIVINADPAFTYKNLLKTNYNKKWNYRKIKKLDFSMGLLFIFLEPKKIQ